MTTTSLNPSLGNSTLASAPSSTLQSALALASRVLFAVMFIPAGLSKISGFEGTAGYIASVGLPLPAVGAAIAIVVEVIVALALLVGYRTRVAAAILAVFTLAASVFFHAYWSLPADKVMVQQLMFFKNIAIVGGLLALVAFGAGKWSLDARSARA
jgi:putative oxidoreductase